jgi:tetratricopeptide (TPR) repeat protein
MADKPTFESIDAVDIELADRDSSTTATAPPDGRKNYRKTTSLILTATGCLLVVATLAVIFLLPDWVKQGGTVTAPSTPTMPVTEDSPYLQAQLAEARKQAQAILAQLLEAQMHLKNKKASLWGGEAAAEISALAGEGDKVYRLGQFDKALALYSQALELANDLLNKSNSLIEEKLAEGFAAIDRNDQQSALAAFDLVLEVEEGNSRAKHGRDRARLMTKTLPLLTQARQDIEAGDWQAARQNLQAILALDSDVKVAAQLLAQVDAKLAGQAFNRAMSAGFRALETGQFSSAVEHFQAATALQPDSQEAKSSLAQARAERQRQFVSQTLLEAKNLEQQELWQEAVASYARVAASDASIVEARVGQMRAQARADLHSQIEKILSDPLRLASDSVYRQAGQLLVEARKIGTPGPILNDQINQLSQALESAVKPVTVTLSSDNQTTVTLLRVARLGAFQQHRLTLRPGRYVALGSRPGFRDVRVPFEVTAGDSVAVTVICSEPV